MQPLESDNQTVSFLIGFFNPIEFLIGFDPNKITGHFLGFRIVKNLQVFESFYIFHLYLSNKVMMMKLIKWADEGSIRIPNDISGIFYITVG